MKTLFFIFISIFFVNQANAIGNITGKVVMVRVDGSGKAMVYFDKPITGEPATCVHSAYKSALGFDASTEGGKAVLSFVLTAKATGAPVTAYGLGICGVYNGSVVETWNYGLLK